MREREQQRKRERERERKTEREREGERISGAERPLFLLAVTSVTGRN